MARLAKCGERAISELIARYELHAEMAVPVPIRQVARDEGWIIRFSERMGRLYGVAVVIEDVRVMQINARVSDTYQRLAIAHEMGHVLNGDASAIHFCSPTGGSFAGWLRNRQERQASIAAARILIPDWALGDAETIQEIASLCEVPDELVKLRVGR